MKPTGGRDRTDPAPPWRGGARNRAANPGEALFSDTRAWVEMGSKRNMSNHFSDDPIIADDIAYRVSKALESGTIQRFHRVGRSPRIAETRSRIGTVPGSACQDRERLRRRPPSRRSASWILFVTLSRPSVRTLAGYAVLTALVGAAIWAGVRNYPRYLLKRLLSRRQRDISTIEAREANTVFNSFNVDGSVFQRPLATPPAPSALNSCDRKSPRPDGCDRRFRWRRDRPMSVPLSARGDRPARKRRVFRWHP